MLIENSEGGGVLKSKILKGKCEAKLEFLEGWGLNQKLSMGGGVWMFSGTIPYK